MLRLRKGFDFVGAWTVQEQNQLLAFCFGLLEIKRPEKRTGSAHRMAYAKVCDKPR